MSPTAAPATGQQQTAANPIPVPLLDVGRDNLPLLPEIEAAIARVCKSGQFIYGPDCRELEQNVARLCNATFGIGCASGSDALLLALMAIDVGPGDEVIVPSFTFFATASAVWRLGARPVFVDIDPDTFNIGAAQAEEAITPSTRAIIPVHLFGQCVDMDPLAEVAQRHELRIIEDAAQAIGSKYRSRPAGSLGDIGCFSFYPTKNLGGFGDGGMLTTSNEELADKLRLLCGHGMRPRYYHQLVGINSRLDSLQAAVLNIKLAHLQAGTMARCENAARYGQLFAAAGLDGVLGLPPTMPECDHVWNQYTIRVPGGLRDALREHLSQAKIGTEIYYPVPLHQQACFASLGYGEGSLPETERAAKEVLSLPIFPGLTAQEQETVVEQISTFLARHGAV